MPGIKQSTIDRHIALAEKHATLADTHLARANALKDKMNGHGVSKGLVTQFKKHLSRLTEEDLREKAWKQYDIDPSDHDHAQSLIDAMASAEFTVGNGE